APTAPQRPAMPQPSAPVRVGTGPNAGAPRRPAGMAPSLPQGMAQGGMAQGGMAHGYQGGQQALPHGYGQAPAAPVNPPVSFEPPASQPVEAPSPEDMPAPLAHTELPAMRGPAVATPRPMAPPPVSAPPASSGGFNLFRKATGLMRRNLAAEGDAPRPVAPQPVAQPQQAAPRPAPAPVAPPAEEMGLDIPTFLRRQNN
ncbi:hypothetical protein NON00_19395, partial [Roseomonas sp. GC11]|nr:hypothetical protein [Roseomonas sp. GC11]